MENTFLNELRQIANEAEKNHPKVVEEYLKEICKMNARRNNMQFRVREFEDAGFDAVGDRRKIRDFLSPDSIPATDKEIETALESEKNRTITVLFLY